ncbi:MAG: hypothetical protein IKE33_01030 [Erysipelotrichaceae bacterium]|nr:hypothetical protein [Erysipelotrichaceae bacterium]
MRSKVVRINSIDENKIMTQIKAKPELFLALMFVFSFVILMFNGYLGFALMMITTYCFIFFPERRLIDFCDEYLIIYNDINHEVCYMLYYDEIVSWQYVSTFNADKLVIALINNQVYETDIFNRHRTERIMERFVPERGLKSIRG